MPKTLVLCADGTCNAFGYASSNVARLVEYLDLDAVQQVQRFRSGTAQSYLNSLSF